MLQIFTVRSADPDSTSLPSGEKATETTSSLCPRMVRGSGAGAVSGAIASWRRVRGPLGMILPGDWVSYRSGNNFHNLTELSPDPDRAVILSGERATLNTKRRCPV